MSDCLYDFDEEQRLAQTVAKKVLQSDNIPSTEKEKIVTKTYQQTLKNRALRFLKEIEIILDSLSNREIANLLKVLLADWLEIESEEELEYWIALLERQANLRLSVYWQMSNEKALQTAGFSDYTGIHALLQSVIKLHVRRQPPTYNKLNYKSWKQLLNQYKKVGKIIKKDMAVARLNKTLHQRRQQSHANVNTLDLLENKMLGAGVQPNGTYWNEVVSNYMASPDHMAFVERWTADQSKIDAENQKDSPTKEKTPAEKNSLQNEAAQMVNHVMALRGFENPRNQKIAQEAGHKKTERTGQPLDYDDIKKIKGQIVSGGR